MQRHLAWVLVAVVGLAGCGGEEEETGAWPSAEARTMREGAAPTPFTAAQIREACAPGRRATFRIEVPGQPPFLQTFRFLEGGEEGCLVELSRTDAEGAPVSEPATSRSTWAELQSHASYAAEDTTIRVEDVEVPAGAFPGAILYLVERTAGGKATVTQAWFARQLPGPPVKMIQLVEGEVATTMTLIEHEPGGK